MSRSIRRFMVAGCVAGCGIVAGAVFGAAYLESKPIVPAPLLTGAGLTCLRPQGRDPATKTFFKIAATKAETKPFQPIPGTAAVDDREAEVSLLEGLGTLHYPVSTSQPLAQRYFDQGLRLAYAFNHAEARRAFRHAQAIDPDCAMCYWGEALVLGPNINAPMDAAALEPALAASAKARMLKGGASLREQMLIDALAKRYSADPKLERPALDTAYAEAMGNVFAAFPEDQNIAVLYAESLMDLSPWDYWEAGGARPKGRTAEIIANLERVLKAHPDHAGAIHYYIHMVEASTTPQRAASHADRLGQLMPGAGHIVHMPFHIYYRIGRYKDALEANQRAVAADEAYIAKAAPRGIYPEAYYPHNVHSLMVSAQMAGAGRNVIESAVKLQDIVSAEAVRTIPWVQPIKAAPYFAHAQFSNPATVLALPDPGNDAPYVKAMWHYARGVALAAQGKREAARAEADAISHIASSADFADLTAGGIPAKDVLAIAAHIVQARIAQSAGDLKAATREFEMAIALEDQLPYSEPPHWYYPVRQSLGATMLMSGDLDGAEQAFRASLARAPNNGWALYGLAEVYRKRGDQGSAQTVEAQLWEMWMGDRRQLDLARL